VIKVLFFGDVYGRAGREVLKTSMPTLKEKYKPDLVLANGENLAHGFGLTQNTFDELTLAGVDVVTGGNHSFKNAQGAALFENFSLPILKPFNWQAKPGRGFLVWTKNGIKVAIINLMGQVFMKEDDGTLENPFVSARKLLEEEKELAACTVKLVDFHAEATGEKVAMGHFLDGKVSAVLGTHTHVQTADAKVLDGGTGYISDVGMCGAYNSVIGLEKDNVVDAYFAGKFGLAEPETKGRRQINGVFLEIDEKSGKCNKIKAVNNVFA
jgi:metallophosphoesterase (TIGR00282 family)